MDFWYVSAYWDLATCRAYEFGAIPWTAIVQYGYHVGLERDMIDPFVAIIRHMDHAYLQWSAEEQERKRKQRESEAKSKRTK